MKGNAVVIDFFNVQAVIVLLVILLIIFCIMLLRYKNMQQKLGEALKEAKEAEDERKNNFSVLQSVADIYYSMHLIDLDENSVTEYQARNQVKSVTDSCTCSDADELMRNVISITISDQYVQPALEFSEVTTLKKRMKNKKVISADFLGKNVGWVRMSFITINTSGDGVPQKVLCTTQIIDDEKKKEEKLRFESNTDELTGCFNRRAYEDNIMNYPDIPAEEDYVYIAMDINGLKAANDNFGHEAGDELILGAVSCMRRCLGNYGNIYRTGGDEFVAIIFANEPTLSDIKLDFEDAQTHWKGKLTENLAVSCGYVTKREFPDMTVRQMAVEADKRMYAAKANYYRSKGIDRRGQAAAHTALCRLYKKIFKISLTEDTYQIINSDLTEHTAEKGFSTKLSEWLSKFGKTGQVYPDDLDEYLRKTDLDFLREYFRSGLKSLSFLYRRKYGDSYRHTIMEIIPSEDYTDEDQSMYLYVKLIE